MMQTPSNPHKQTGQLYRTCCKEERCVRISSSGRSLGKHLTQRSLNKVSLERLKVGHNSAASRLSIHKSHLR